MSRPIPALRHSTALLLLSIAGVCFAAPTDFKPFLQKYCLECHDSATQKGGLDLETLAYTPADRQNLDKWVTIHDRVRSGEMPPKKKARPDTGDLAIFIGKLSQSIVGFEQERIARDGRAVQRRLNRYEYENAVRDLLGAPWLQIRDGLPEDGEANRFNKVGDALDVSHVQMARYMSVADYALRQVMATQVDRPQTKTTRYYTRDQRSFTGKMKFSVFNTRPERATFPVLGAQPQPDVRSGKAPMTVGQADPKTREEEAVGVVASTYEPLEIRWNEFTAPAAGHYKLRFKTWTLWVGPGKPEKWWIPDLDSVAPGRRPEPITIYSETPPRLLRRLGTFDAQIQPQVAELDTWLLEGETIRPDAARLFRSRPPAWVNPLADKDGCPGVAFAWMEVEGPIHEQWPTAGHRLLFGDLPLRKSDRGVEVVSTDPTRDAQRLMRQFMAKAYRRPVVDADVSRMLRVVEAALKAGGSFADAMIAGYTAVLCSPAFVCIEEKPGKLDDHALATRLALFLWNSPPDAQLRRLADTGELRQPKVLSGQVDRLLNDPRSRRFVDAFLDYWLDLRKLNNTSPDGTLYPDYYLDDLLTESAQEETQLFFNELIRANLPARNLISSDFAIVNERLANHYGIPGVDGVTLRKIKLPADSVRGGLLTQASILKVTANGTTTSPVIRGVWILERILGEVVPPPPKVVAAVEPDTRGATTIRQQLDKHRNVESCAACHVKIDPAGFALESFDIMGGWRQTYRALGEQTAEKGIGKNGQKFTFHAGPKVDATGALPDGRKFNDIRELKNLLCADERQIARNLVRQLVCYSTGAPVGFADRAKVEGVLDTSLKDGFGTRSLIREIVLSDLFRMK